ncbi:MAG: ribonuclease P protein component [Candidatus Aminicenantales bacterium]
MLLKGEGEKEDKNYQPNPKKKNTFPSSLKIQKREEFRLIYSKGERFSSHSFSLFVLGKGFGKGRLGITVTKKVGKAVKRNRIKRMIREIFRKNKDKFGERIDIIVHTRPEAANKSYQELEEEFLTLAKDIPKE